MNFVLRSRARYTLPNLPCPSALPISKSLMDHRCLIGFATRAAAAPPAMMRAALEAALLSLFSLLVVEEITISLLDGPDIEAAARALVAEATEEDIITRKSAKDAVWRGERQDNNETNCNGGLI